MQTYAQTNEAQHTAKGNNPPLPVASVAAIQYAGSPKLQTEAQTYIDADVRIVSAPAKDRYDKSAFWINAVLAVIGALGIGAAFITLRKLERQTKATEKAAKAQMDADRGWVLIHGKRDPPALRECIEKNIVPGVIIEVKITGNTPARIVRERYRCLIVPAVPNTSPPEPQLDEVPAYTTEASFFGVDGVVRAPGDHYGVNSVLESGMLTHGELVALRGEETVLCAYGSIEYQDAFGRDGLTKFLLVYRFESGGVSETPDGTRMTPGTGFRAETRAGYSETT
jgi:hypothetical protein